MKKFIVYIVVIMICLVGSVCCCVYYGGRINNTDPNTTTKPSDPQSYNDSDFSIKLLKTVNSINSDNYLVSPYSIQTALSMVRDGANGKTKEEIDSLIGTNKPAKINNTNIKISNAMFLKNKYKTYTNNTYTTGLVNNYNSEMLFDEFQTPKVINDWVNNKTDGMIEKVVDSLDPDFVLGLANAIAIDVKWASEFECESTVEAEFTKKDGTKKKVEMMNKTYEYNGSASYIESDKATGIVVPYKEDTNLEYVAILPNDSIDSYINDLTKDKLDSLINNRKSASDKLHIRLSLPRYTYDYDLTQFGDVLKTMGMNEAFNPDTADFTGIMTKDNMSKSGVGNLYISQSVHKTHIELNEAGTKAAAVTFFGMSKNSLAPSDFEVKNVNLNKTYLYMIREKTTGSILFLGVVNSPNEWKGTTCSNSEL